MTYLEFFVIVLGVIIGNFIGLAIARMLRDR